MIIRCPQCEHSRSVNEAKIPATAELATCPKCKHRFRFRSVSNAAEGEEYLFSSQNRQAPAKVHGVRDKRIFSETASIPSGIAVERPQGAVREAAARRGDIQDAIDSVQHAWQTRMDQHVTEVVTPRPESMERSARETSAAVVDGGQSPPPSQGGGFAASDEPGAPEETPRRESVHALEKATADLLVRLGDDPARTAENPTSLAERFSAKDTPARTAENPSGETAPESETVPVAKAGGYFYSGDGPRPEERVEQDMRLLREAPESRPVRNLGSLRDELEMPPLSGERMPRLDDLLPEAGQDGYVHENAVPWENPAAHGWIKAFMSTLYGVMFQGPAFFSRFSENASLGPGYLFFLILGYVTILGSLLWSHALAVLLPGTVQAPDSRVALPALLLLAPVALGLMLLFVTGCIRVVLLLFAPEKSVFSLVYRIVSYSMAPFILSIVPFVGPAIGAAWFIVALVTGCRNALKLSWKLSLFIPLPPAAMLLGGMVWYFL